jgi:thiazole/oxazole-forming peptide maturase SagD family component
MSGLPGATVKDDLLSPYVGLVSRWGAIARRPHDPDASCWAGLLPRWAGDDDLAVGGAAWTQEAAQAASLGEAVERWQPQPLPWDEFVEARYSDWNLDEEAVAPERWVLFSDEQYAQAGFPFAPLRKSCRWVCCREAATGRPVWAPAGLVFLASDLPPIAPSISTGLSAGRRGDPVLLRGAQEVIERDALLGAWWGRYPLEEYDPGRVWRSLPSDVPARLCRPSLSWRFYRVDTPLSSHATIVTLSGDDHEGFCFSAGSACRATRRESWLKSLLEAVQGRHYVRFLRQTPLAAALKGNEPDSFAAHALYYSLHPQRLAQTPLHSARSADAEDLSEEALPHLRERLGAGRPILFRLMTPPGLERDWTVARVLIPGTQPLHGHHRFPFLGGPLWAPRGLGDWRAEPPHPFP